MCLQVLALTLILLVCCANIQRYVCVLVLCCQYWEFVAPLGERVGFDVVKWLGVTSRRVRLTFPWPSLGVCVAY